MDEFYPEFGFLAGWMGVTCCTISFIFLTMKAIEQKRKLNKESDGFNENKHLKHDMISLLINAFGCTTSTFIYCLYYGTFGSIPVTLNIILTEPICQYTAQYLANAGFQFARYFYYNFMLFRIRASFREPKELKLSKLTFTVYLILIHLWLIWALIVTVFFTPRYLTADGNCGVVVHTISPGFTTTDTRTVIWSFDFILTAALLMMFLRRLSALTEQNKKINIYRRKTVFLGICATLSSIAMSVFIFLAVSKVWRFFIPIDLVINMCCVVFTFKYECSSLCPCYDALMIAFKLKSNDHEKHQHESLKQESTYTPQPPDAEVWSILCKSERNTYRSDVKDIGNGLDVNQPLNAKTTIQEADDMVDTVLEEGIEINK